MKILATDMEQRDEVTVYFCWSLKFFVSLFIFMNKAGVNINSQITQHFSDLVSLVSVHPVPHTLT